jgi:hypothetical protein
VSGTKSGDSIKEIGEGLKSILERIADFFDIFDLSFLVSGVTTAAALSYWAWRADMQLPPVPTGWMAAVGLIITGYVLGLICFALGRWLRTGWRSRISERSFYNRFIFILDGHGLRTLPPFSEYLERKDAQGDWRLYVRMWAELRLSPSLAPSFSLLRRYWVMAATYDGVAVALCVWVVICVLCAFGIGGARPINKWLALPLTVALIVSAVACSREAGRYVNYQVEELVASIAAKRATRA